jgi:formylglycine-generating enzyme required for sulfatase activity/flavodoxin
MKRIIVTAGLLSMLLLTACAGKTTLSQSTRSAGKPDQIQTLQGEPYAMNLIRIEGGTFIMGSPESEPNRVNDEIQHKVTVSGFYMAAYEVTQQQYETVMGENPSRNKGARKPVENVSWFNAVTFCNWLSEAEGLTSAYIINGDNYTWDETANGYRLPTEAEWEYAARAGTTTAYSTGGTITNEQATFGGGGTTDAGSHPANQFGLYDMHGNVFEWCWDFHGPYSAQDQTDPKGAVEGVNRILRGGSCADQAQYLRSALRVHYPPSTEFFDVGFRVVRSAIDDVLIAYFTHEGNTNFTGDRGNMDAITSASVQRQGDRFPPQFYKGQRMGNTQIIANYISEYTGGRLFAIKTINSYPVDAYATLDAAQVEHSRNLRPELSTHVENMDRYDTIYLGFPIWWGTFSMPVFTFLEEYNFAGKIIIPFSTHDGSGLAGSIRDIKSLCPGAVVMDGIAIRYSSIPRAKATVESWIDKINAR